MEEKIEIRLCDKYQELKRSNRSITMNNNKKIFEIKMVIQIEAEKHAKDVTVFYFVLFFLCFFYFGYKLK